MKSIKSRLSSAGLVAVMFLLCLQTSEAAKKKSAYDGVPDFTKQETVAPTNDLENALGTTGVYGWIYKGGIHSDGVTQIYVTRVTPGTFTAGVLTGVSVTPTVAGSNLTLTVNDGSGHTGSATIATINPAPTAYDVWAGNAPFDGDANGDGVDNGLAFLLGAAGPNVNALGKLPAPTQSAGDLKLTFQMLPSTARGGATLAIEHGITLANGSWSTVAVPDASGTVGDVNFTITGTNPLSVTATIPASKAAAGKLFGRVRATE